MRRGTSCAKSCAEGAARHEALSGQAKHSCAGFQSRAPHDSLERGRESSGRILQSCARFGRREDRRAPLNAGGPLHAVGAPELAPDPHYWDRTPVQEHLPAHITGTHNELHVHPVVDLVVRAAVVRLVVLRFFPGRYSGNIVAPVGVARRRVVVARPLRRFIDETHLLLVLICQ